MYLLEVNVRLLEAGDDEHLDARISLPLTVENVDACKSSIDQWLPTIINFVQGYLEQEGQDED